MLQGLPPEPVVHALSGNAALIVIVAIAYLTSMLLIGTAVLMAMRYRAPLAEERQAPPASVRGGDPGG